MLIIENVIWLLVLIGVMILIHELGHYWAARFFDVKVDIFSFGFGPRLFGIRRGETDFRFSAILFGGYVKMAGENPGDPAANDPRSFLAKPRWQRLIIAFAGPAMNVVLAVGLLTGLFMVRFQKPSGVDGPAVIGHVLPNTPAAQAGIRAGDRVLEFDGIKNPVWQDVVMKELASAKKTVAITVERRGQRIQTSITPVLDERLGMGVAGWVEEAEIQIGAVTSGMPAEKAGLKPGDVLLSVDGTPIRSRFKLQEIIRASGGKPVTLETVRNKQRRSVVVHPQKTLIEGKELWMIGVEPAQRFVEVRLSFPEALKHSVSQNLKTAALIYRFLVGLVERRMSARSLEGPIRIAQISGEAARQGLSTFIALMSMVSLNLAIFNLLPIPILDGGVILLLLIEMLLRRDLSLPVKEAVFKLGFVFLMAVVVFVLYNDLSKILPAG